MFAFPCPFVKPRKRDLTVTIPTKINRKMNRKRVNKPPYVSPKCEIIEVGKTNLICASVLPHAGASTTPSKTDFEDKGTHDMGTIYFGSKSSVAPAKPGGWWDEEED